MQVYHLDPDFRRNPPVKPFVEVDKPYCICCRKPLLDKAENLPAVIQVTVNWENWTVAEDHNQDDLINPDKKHVKAAFENGLMGPTCWKKTKKNPVHL